MSDFLDGRGPYPWLPDIDWPVLAPFWASLRDGALAFPRCTECARFQWYPQPMCPGCGAMAFAWTDVRPAGTVFTFTVVRKAFLPGFADRLPTTVGLVTIDDAPAVRLVTNLKLADGSDGAERATIGSPVTIRVEEVAPAVCLPFGIVG